MNVEDEGKIICVYTVLANEFGSYHAVDYIAAMKPSKDALDMLCRLHYRRTGVVHTLDPKRLPDENQDWPVRGLDFARSLDDTITINQPCEVMHPDSDEHVLGCDEEG